MQSRIFSRIVGLTTTLTTNLLNPGTTTGGVNCTSTPYGNLRITLRQIRIVNTTSGAITVTIYKGATGANTAGTEIIKAKTVPANDYIDFWYQNGLNLDTGDFLVGGAGSGSSNDMNAQFNGEIMIA